MNKTLLKLKSIFSLSKIKQALNRFCNTGFKEPLSLIYYPNRGFDEFKAEKKGKTAVAIFYLVMMILAQIIAFNGNGFLVNKNNPKDFNLLLTIALVVFPVLIFVIANWATTALMDGKGNMSEIFKVITYAFFPFV